jgi:hypothetical protein
MLAVNLKEAAGLLERIWPENVHIDLIADRCIVGL